MEKNEDKNIRKLPKEIKELKEPKELKELEEPKEPKEWHPQHHHILKEWAEVGYSYRYLHDKAYLYYSSQNFKFALPVIIISTLTGTANFAQKSFPESWQDIMPLVIGSFNLAAGLITTIAQFLRVSELLEGHRAASIVYDKFARNISVELSLPIKERELSGSDFIAKCRMELDKLIEQSPNIPQHIIKQFANKFKEKAFFKPNILDINPIEIYVDDDNERLKALELVEKEKEKEREIKHKLLKEQEEMKNKILDNIHKVEEENKKKICEELKRQKQDFERHKLEKKQKISTRSVTKNIDKILLGINNIGDINNTITPDTSDLDSNEDTSPISISNNLSEINRKPRELLNNISILIKEEKDEKDEKDKKDKKDKNNNSITRIPKPKI